MKKVLCSLLAASLCAYMVPARAEEDVKSYNDFIYEVQGDRNVIVDIAIPEHRKNIVSNYANEFAGAWEVEVKVPYMSEGMVFDLGKEALRGEERIAKIVFEEGITVIPDGLCRDMPNLREVVLPESVSEIRFDAFRDCPKLSKINLENVKIVLEGAFENTLVHDPNDYSYMEKDNGLVILGYVGQDEVLNIPEYIDGYVVDGIYENAFMGVENVKKIIMPDTVTHMGMYAFGKCKNLEEVIISNSVTNILPRTFWENKNLKKVVLGKSVADVQSGAFTDCAIDNLIVLSKDTKIARAIGTTTIITGHGQEVKMPILQGFTSTAIGTIYAPIGSDAEKFAIENSINYVPIDENGEIINPEAEQKDDEKKETASDWAVEYIQKAEEMGVVTENLRENWKVAITREEFCETLIKTISYNLDYELDAFFDYVAGCEMTLDNVKFSDSDNRFVLLAASMGIVKGRGDGKFEPEAFITREEAAVMLTRARNACFCVMMYKDLEYADSDLISHWAVDGVKHVDCMGIMNGVGENRFDPKGTYTREQAIATFTRLFKEETEKTVNHYVATGDDKYVERPTYEKKMKYYTENYNVKNRWDTKYGTILDLEKGDRHGNLIPLMFIKNDGTEVCINREAPWSNWYNQMKHKSLVISEDEKTAVITYPTFTEPREFHPPSVSGIPEYITGTFVFNLNMETGELVRELIPLEEK